MTMGEQKNDLEPSTSSVQSSEVTGKLVRVPRIVLDRIDEKTILNLKTKTRSKKPPKKNTQASKKLQKVLKPSPKKTNDTEIKRPRGRPKKILGRPKTVLGRPKKTNEISNLEKFKKNTLKLGAKNKISPAKTLVEKKNNLNLRVKNKTKLLNKNSAKGDLKLKSKPVMLKKTLLQKRSKVLIPQAKKSKGPPIKVTKSQSPAEGKPTPPKPKLEIIQSNIGDNSSDSSGDEFLYDELIEELENTANKRMVETKPVPEKTTITLKPNTGNKPPTVLKGGIVKKTDLPLNLNLLVPSTTKASNVITNGIQKTKQTGVLTPSGKRKSSGIYLESGPTKKPSPWPVSLVPSPKKSPATNLNSKKKTELATSVGVSQPSKKTIPQISQIKTFSPPPSTEGIFEPSNQSNSITLGISKPKIGPKKTAKVVPMSKSFDADEYNSDEYLEPETLECDEVVLLPKKSPTKSNTANPKAPLTGRNAEQDANLDLIKILTDDSEEPIKIKSNETKEKPVASKVDIQTKIREEKTQKQEQNATTEVPTEVCLDSTSEHSNEIEEAPVRTIYDVMNEVFLEYPSWNLHIIPETSAFCIAQVTKGRLGLPTLKKCIELDPVTYSAKVYIHQYHIKRFDAVYDGEESILALIREIDSIKA